jgi:hypothetical protein
VTSFGQEVLKSGQDAEWAAGKYGVATDALNKLNTAAIFRFTSNPINPLQKPFVKTSIVFHLT